MPVLLQIELATDNCLEVEVGEHNLIKNVAVNISDVPQ